MKRGVKISDHARRRMDQRGISREEVRHIARNGRKIRKTSHGATVIETSDNDIARQMKGLYMQIRKMGKPTCQADHEKISELKKRADKLEKMRRRKSVLVIKNGRLMTTYTPNNKKKSQLKRRR